MAEFLNPVLFLGDLVHVFEDAAATSDGMPLDPELCRHFADGLAEVMTQVEALVAYFQGSQAAQCEPSPERDRTPVERRTLARLSVRLDPAGRVLSFPAVPVRRVAITEGGSAA